MQGKIDSHHCVLALNDVVVCANDELGTGLFCVLHCMLMQVCLAGTHTHTSCSGRLHLWPDGSSKVIYIEQAISCTISMIVGCCVAILIQVV